MEDIINFKVASAKEFPNLKLTENQIKLIITALSVYKDYVTKEGKCKISTEYELGKINILFDFLQDISNWNYEHACNKCINKYAKKIKNDDPGLETFSWLEGGKNEK